MNNDFEIVIIVLVFFFILFLFGFYVIYNPIVKIKDGCFTWQRDNNFSNFSLIDDYNYSCINLDKIIDFNLYNKVDEVLIQTTTCKGKFIKDKKRYFTMEKIKNEYFERCIRN